MPAIILYSIAAGFFSTGTLFGAWWATRRREECLKANQPLDGARWGQPETYEKLTAQLRSGGAL